MDWMDSPVHPDFPERDRPALASVPAEPEAPELVERETPEHHEREAPEPARPPRQRTTMKAAADPDAQVVVDGSKLVERLAKITRESERARVRLESEKEKRRELRDLLETQALERSALEAELGRERDKLAELNADLERENRSRRRAEGELFEVRDLLAAQEQEIKLMRTRLQSAESELQHRRPRWRR